MLSVESALRIAILRNPESFGLSDEDVNPLLVFFLNEDQQASREDLLGQCVDECNATIYLKLQELLAISIQPQARRPRESKEEQATGRKPAPKSSSSETLKGKATPNQIRRIGYLTYQKGETPDYPAISKLSIKEASGLIARLEKGA